MVNSSAALAPQPQGNGAPSPLVTRRSSLPRRLLFWTQKSLEAGDSNEVRQNCILDCRHFWRAGSSPAVLHVGHHRPPGSAAHHSSPVLLRVRRRGAGLAVRISYCRYQPGALPADDSSLRAGQGQLCAHRRRPHPPGTHDSGRMGNRPARRNSNGIVHRRLLHRQSTLPPPDREVAGFLAFWEYQKT